MPEKKTLSFSPERTMKNNNQEQKSQVNFLITMKGHMYILML